MHTATWVNLKCIVLSEKAVPPASVCTGKGNSISENEMGWGLLKIKDWQGDGLNSNIVHFQGNFLVAI